MAIKIFVDQEHNPSGLCVVEKASGVQEQDSADMIVGYLTDLLDMDYRFEVRTSRTDVQENLTTSSAPSLSDRVDAANNWPADYFINIHINENDSLPPNQTKAYVSKLFSEGSYIAEKIMEEIFRRTQQKEILIRENSSFFTLRDTLMPSVLISLAPFFKSKEMKNKKNTLYQLAYSIYAGLLNFFGFRPL